MSSSTALPCGSRIAVVAGGRDRAATAAPERLIASRDIALEHGHEVTAIVAAALLRRVEVPAVEDELVARDEPLDVRAIGRLRNLRRDGPAAIVDRVERLLNVERPRLAVAVEAVPIEEAKRRVARLLDFGDHQSVAERVDRAGFEEDAIADLAARADGGTRRSCRPPARARAARDRRPA